MKLLVVTPVKDSIDTFEMTARSVMNSQLGSEWEYVVYDDYSTPENALRLDILSRELGFAVVHLSDVVHTPSPNYRYVLQVAQVKSLEENCHLLIVESDVTVNPDTFDRMMYHCDDKCGMVAAVTVDEHGTVNFPYLYAAKYPIEVHATKKRLSFCCTLLAHRLLSLYDFQNLDASKAWYDVTISHTSVSLGLNNILDMSNRVIHRPHSSRPWKQLKYTNPLKYYWLKFTRGLDKI